jgi:SsrA-binding protein
MPEPAERKRKSGTLTDNRKAFRDYEVLEKHEAGIELVGTEVKVLRNHEGGLKGAYAKVENGELWLHQVTIPQYAFGNRFNHDSLRSRRLLMHRREILKLQAKQEQKGLALIPLRSYLTPKGRVKVEVGVCKGKSEIDKRETVKRREADIEAKRAMARVYR